MFHFPRKTESCCCTGSALFFLSGIIFCAVLWKTFLRISTCGQTRPMDI